MSHKTSLSDVIKQLKAELLNADNDRPHSGLQIASAEVSLKFSTANSDDGSFAFNVLNDEKDSNPHQLKLVFSVDKTAKEEFELSFAEESRALDGIHKKDDFETFKKKFEANVKLKHGQIPSKKKSIFDD